MIKNLLLLVVISFLTGIGCKKNDYSCGYTITNVVAPAEEQQALHDSLNLLGINNATLDPSGFYYTINKQGDGSSATSLCTTLAVFYRGGFLNGKGFDSTSGNPLIFQLGQMIQGWQKGLPLIKKSGDITLYIPPSLGYGSKPVVDTANKVIIPPNTNLVFRVVLADVQ